MNARLTKKLLETSITNVLRDFENTHKDLFVSSVDIDRIAIDRLGEELDTLYFTVTCEVAVR